MTFSDWKELADAFASAVTALAILGAAAWAFYKFVLEGYYEESLVVKVACSVSASDGGPMRIIGVRAEVTNVGKVPSRIDVERSTLTIGKLRETTAGWTPKYESQEAMVLATKPDIRNIPPGSTTSLVYFFQVEQPARCAVTVFVAQTERGARRFYKRIRRPFPENWKAELVGFQDATIVEVTSTAGPAPVI